MLWSIPLNNFARRMPPSGMLSRVAPVRKDISEESRFLQEPHGVTPQKTAFFIVTAVKNSNLKLH
jgi:hypothetical protein